MADFSADYTADFDIEQGEPQPEPRLRLGKSATYHWEGAPHRPEVHRPT